MNGVLIRKKGVSLHVISIDFPTLFFARLLELDQSAGAQSKC